MHVKRKDHCSLWTLRVQDVTEQMLKRVCIESIGKALWQQRKGCGSVDKEHTHSDKRHLWVKCINVFRLSFQCLCSYSMPKHSFDQSQSNCEWNVISQEVRDVVCTKPLIQEQHHSEETLLNTTIFHVKAMNVWVILHRLSSEYTSIKTVLYTLTVI